jgi:DNA-binding transcriptional LysR family regulator
MSTLPDFEGLAIFAKVVEVRSFAAAATELKLSKATVSKAVSRLEGRLGARLFNRTSRRLALTDAGRRLSSHAARVLAEGVAAENDALSLSAVPRGTVHLAVPMSFGLRAIAPILPEFMKLYPEVNIEMHLADHVVDLIGEGFDIAVRLTELADSSLVARRIRALSYFIVAAPSYWDRHGRPGHPSELATHTCLVYSYQRTPGAWRLENRAGEAVTVRLGGSLRANNADALMPALLAGLGVIILPDFLARDAIEAGKLEAVLPGWSFAATNVNLVMPPGGPRPARVEALADFLVQRLGQTPRRPRKPA